MARQRLADHLKRKRLVLYVTDGERAMMENYIRQIRGNGVWQEVQSAVNEPPPQPIPIFRTALPIPTAEQVDSMLEQADRNMKPVKPKGEAKSGWGRSEKGKLVPRK